MTSTTYLPDLHEYDESATDQPAIPAPITTSYFKDFLLRDELTTALKDVQFEHPSAVQQHAIPRAILGVDVLCQAKSGTGKTAVFVLATLQQVDLENLTNTTIVVLVHTKELAQVKNEFVRFARHMEGSKAIKNIMSEIDRMNEINKASKQISNTLRIEEFYGGSDISLDIARLQNGPPTIFIGTPGRTHALLTRNLLDFSHVKHFVLDEVDEMLGELSMRHTIQRILYHTPVNKQNILVTATLSEETKQTCMLFLRDPHVVLIDEERSLVLHGLAQYFVNVNKTSNGDKRKCLESIIDGTEFIQMVIFASNKGRVIHLTEFLKNKGFPAIDFHSGLTTVERVERFKRFKEMKARIMVATNLIARGIDVADVNVVVNYDMPECAETYLHRVGRAGRFETKGMAISLVESASDSTVLNDVQARFEVSIKEMEVGN